MQRESLERNPCWKHRHWDSGWHLNGEWRVVSVAQSCATLCDPMDCSPPDSSVHGIFQARVLEWGAVSFFRGSSQPRDRTLICVSGRCFTLWATRAQNIYIHIYLYRWLKYRQLLNHGFILNIQRETLIPHLSFYTREAYWFINCLATMIQFRI